MTYTEKANSSKISNSWEIDDVRWSVNAHMGVDLLEVTQDLPNGICLTKGDARKLREAIDWFLEHGK